MVLLSLKVTLCPTERILSSSFAFFSLRSSIFDRDKIIRRDFSSTGIATLAGIRLGELHFYYQFQRQGRNLENCVCFLFETARFPCFSCCLGLRVVLSSSDIYDAFSNSSHSSAFVAKGLFCPLCRPFLGLLFLSQHVPSSFVWCMESLRIMVYICVVNRNIVEATYHLKFLRSCILKSKRKWELYSNNLYMSPIYIQILFQHVINIKNSNGILYIAFHMDFI